MVMRLKEPVGRLKTHHHSRRPIRRWQPRPSVANSVPLNAPGEIGALMRREGIYSSLLSTWRTQRRAAERLALEPQKRGPKVNPMLAHEQDMAKLTRENDRLRHQLAQANTIIDVQKKVSSLLAQLTDPKPHGGS